MNSIADIRCSLKSSMQMYVRDIQMNPEAYPAAKVVGSFSYI